MVSDVRPPPPPLPSCSPLLLSSPPQAATPNARAVTRQPEAARERTRKFPSSRKAIPIRARDSMRSAGDVTQSDRGRPTFAVRPSVRDCPAGTAAMMRTVAPRSTSRTVIMNASSALTPSAHMTIQTTRPAVVVTTSPMCGADSISRACGELRHAARATAAARDPSASAAARTSRVPTMTRRRPRRPPRAACSGVADAEAERDRAPRSRPWPARRSSATASASAARSPVVPGHRDRVDEAAGAGADARHALVGRGRRHQRHERDAGRVARRAHGVALLERQVGHDQPGDAVRGEVVGEALDAARHHEVRVDHRPPPGRARPARAPTLEHLVRSSRPRAARACPAAWMTGPSASGSRERDARARRGRRRRRRRPRRSRREVVQVGEAAHQVGHQRRAPARRRRRPPRSRSTAAGHASPSAASDLGQVLVAAPGAGRRCRARESGRLRARRRARARSRAPG